MEEKHFFVVHTFVSDEARKEYLTPPEKRNPPKKSRHNENGLKQQQVNLLGVFRDDLEERGAKERWYLDDGCGKLLPASGDALTKALTRHASQAGIQFQGKILHGFRASLATSLANENPAVAQRILQDANISTTISHYVNLPEATSRTLLDRVSESSSTDSQLPVN